MNRNTVDMPTINDNIEKITSINEQLYNEYNRHHVLNDKRFLFDPTIDPKSYFSNVEDINGNDETTFKVSLDYDVFVLQRLPQYVWETEEEYLKGQFEKLVGEMETSYEFEDYGIPNTRKIHHIFIKRLYSPRKQNFHFCIWSLKEYFPGESVSMFDYGAEHPFQYYNTSGYGSHKPGKLISLKAAKEFAKEIISVYLQLLKRGYLPHRYNDSGIIMNYSDDKIQWRYVDYLYCKKEEPNSDNVRWAINCFHSILCWRMCVYTNYSTHKLSPKYNHPFWNGLDSIMEEKSSYFSKIGSDEYKKYIEQGKRWEPNWPIVPREDFIKTFEEFYDYIDNFPL